MITATTALFVRTLRVETRLFRGYGLRALLGGVVLLLLLTLQSTAYQRSATGLDLIRTIVWSAFACITLAGLSSFCSAITEEKEEGTLGLMRLAGLNPVAILLGKSTARLWEALLLGATMLPFATLAVTLGGVSLRQVLACVVTLAAYVVMLANLGLLWSVLLRTSQGASSAMTVTLVALLLLPFAGGAVALAPGAGWHAVGVVLGWLGAGSVIQQLNLSLMTGSSEPIVAAQAWIDLAIGGAAFGLAWLAFDRFAGGDAESEPRRPVMRRRSRWNLLGLPRPRPGLAALAWKDFHFACGGRLMFLGKVALAIALGAFLAWLSRDSSNQVLATGDAIMVIALLWIGVEFGAHLSRIYALEVRGQTLDGVMTLPYGTAAIAYTKLRPLASAMLPSIAFFIVGAALAPSGFGDGLDDLTRRPSVLLVIATIVLYFWHACAWLSLVLKRAALAGAFALLIVTWLVLLAAISVLEAVVRTHDESVLIALLVVPLLVLSVLMHLAIPRRLRARAAG